MPENHLFEYAVIRVVPRVEREEFVNAGVILLCSKQNFLKCKIQVDVERVKVLSADMDCDVLKEPIHSFVRICAGEPGSGPIGQLTLAERFRWLTASRSTIVQTSPVHPGLCDDPEQMLQHLFDQLVV